MNDLTFRIDGQKMFDSKITLKRGESIDLELYVKGGDFVSYDDINNDPDLTWSDHLDPNLAFWSPSVGSGETTYVAGTGLDSNREITDAFALGTGDTNDWGTFGIAASAGQTFTNSDGNPVLVDIVKAMMRWASISLSLINLATLLIVSLSILLRQMDITLHITKTKSCQLPPLLMVEGCGLVHFKVMITANIVTYQAFTEQTDGQYVIDPTMSFTRSEWGSFEGLVDVYGDADYINASGANNLVFYSGEVVGADSGGIYFSPNGGTHANDLLYVDVQAQGVTKVVDFDSMGKYG